MPKQYGGGRAGWRYRSTLSLTSPLDGVGGQRLGPDDLLPGKEHVAH